MPVDWEKAVPRTRALRLLAGQNSACRLRARFTTDEATRRFGTG